MKEINCKGFAEFFYEQCCGSYSGHMAAIPYNPTLHSFFMAIIGSWKNDKVTQEEFARILRAIADDLDKE